MKPFKFSERSNLQISTLHEDLQVILREAIKTSPWDFGVSHGGRSFDLQLEYFLAGKSTLDPRVPEELARAKHVITADRPRAEAFDIYIYVPGRKDLAYDEHLMTLVAGHILGTAKRLYLEGELSTGLRWGGNWDNDGEIITDQDFDDLPHYELIELR